MAKRDDKKLLEEARRRFKACMDADRANRRLAVDDLEFLHEPGMQWDDQIKSERGNRPCYEFNKLRVTIKRIVNDIRANRPQGKVRATEDGDTETAELMEGLIRNVWANSDGDAAVDTAAEYQVGGGMGAWRVRTVYSRDDAWEQDINIEPIRNPFSLWADPASKDPVKRDARYWFLESRLAKDVYEEKYGKKEAIDFDGSEFEDDEEWQDDEHVRIAEYWYKKPVIKRLALLDDGQTVDMDTTPASALGERQIVRMREVQAHQVCMAVISGDKVLEGPTEWAGTHFPFVVVYGEHLVIDGKVKWFGLARWAKDAQRAYNYSRTLAVEAVALAPQANKWWATPTQAEGNLTSWARAHKENLPYLIYNPDPMAAGPPREMGGGNIPPALVQEIAISSEDIKGVTGIYDPSLGARTNAVSGVAKRAEISQGEIATFNYSDNIARGIRRTWEILTDLIPKVYDTQRTIRVLGNDGAERFAQINTVDPLTGEVTNDLSRGKYDVTITTGPSFATQRQEAAEVYMALMQAMPQVMGLAGDLVFKAVDLPYADEIAERIKATLPPPIQQMLASKEKTGKALPPEAVAAMAKADEAMMLMQQQNQLVQQAAQELEGEKAEVERAKAELNTMLANLKAQQAELRATEAQLEAKIAQANADLDRRAMEVEGRGKDVEHAGQQLEQQAVQAGQQSAVEIVQTALDAVDKRIDQIEQILRQRQEPIIVPVGGGKRSVRVKRVNGEMVGEISDE